MEKMSSSFPSDVLQLLGLSSVIHGGYRKQHVGYLLQIVAAVEPHWVVLKFAPLSEEVWLAGRWRFSTRMDTGTRAK